ncbi:YHYH protein [Gymnodinialimonas sp. 2305UL16-5]|uniref:YHYH protein n=1 Tax=Gymnodinialimonas mytili TaxID=3126503 RepID=UPI003099E37D
MKGREVKTSNRMNVKIRAIAAMLVLAAPAAAQSQAERLDDIARFFANADLVAAPDIVDCTLSQGAEARCARITVVADPQTYTPGPWCPTHIDNTAEAGGIWFHEGEVHDVDGAFIENLATLYGDTNWQLFDPETGEVRYTGTLEACEAAARPDVDPDYQNNCVQCLPEYMPEDASVTYVIPLQPWPADRPSPTNMSGSGVAWNGIRLDGPAPVDAILAAYTIAPFDDCGGHVNLHVGYHYHAVTDCLDGAETATDGMMDGQGAQIGIAMDGHPIFAHEMADGTVPDDLDQCNGHVSDGTPYHYHAGAAGSNAILGCLSAQAGCVLEDPDDICDASARRPRP